MRKLTVYLFLTIMLLANASVHSQTTKTVGTGGDYTTLKLAFDAINGGSVTGNITLNIISNTTETASAVLNASGGTANYSSISIQPSGGSWTISGSLPGNKLIQLNGADYVTIDGLNDGTNTLTLSNTSNSNSTGTSTIMFLSDATNNTITNCTVLGSATHSTSTDGGTIFFSTGTTSGNDNNTISNCKIGPAGANLPTKGIYSKGTGDAVIANSNITINNCEIYNFFISTGGSAGIYAGSGNTAWNITNNKIYQTATRTNTSSATMYGIYFYDFSYGKDVNITGNTIGYSSPNGTGTFTVTGPAFWQTFLYGIYFLGQSAASNPCNINNNTISDISFTTAANGQFVGIQNLTLYNAGNTININNNKVQNISVSTSTSSLNLISALAAGTLNVNGNTVDNISRDADGDIICIGYSNCNSVTLNGNTVKNISTANSSFSSTICGIYHLSVSEAVSSNVRNNKIFNLSSHQSSTQKIYGFWDAYTGFSLTNSISIENNEIYNLSGGATTIGINSATSSKPTIFKNKIYNISTEKTGGTATGIDVNYNYQEAYVYNNFISSISAPTANGISISNSLYKTIYLFYNTVYLNGNGDKSALNKAHHQNTIELRNNIFVVIPGASGTAYAIRWNLDYNSSNYLSTSDKNCLYAGTPSSSNLIFYDGTNSDQTLEAYKTRVATRDANSFSILPPFVNVSTAPYDLRINSAIPNLLESGGSPVTSPAITTDYFGTFRNASTPDVGAHEFGGSRTINNPSSFTATIANSTQIDLSFAPVGGNNVVIVWNTTGIFETPSELPPSVGGSFAGGTLLYNGTGTQFSHTGLTDGTRYYYKIFSFNGYTYSSGVTTDIPLPVTLSSFTSYVNTRNVKLNWSTSSEQNNSGFNVERKSAESEWQNIGFLKGNGTTSAPKNYAFEDRGLSTGKYSYRLKQIDFNGNFEYHTLSGEVEIGVPAKFELSQNYPNPFNPSTKIDFSLPVDSKVSLMIYDISGREVMRIINNEFTKAGYHTAQFNAANLSSGVYFYRIAAGNNVMSKKMLLIK